MCCNDIWYNFGRNLSTAVTARVGQAMCETINSKKERLVDVQSNQMLIVECSQQVFKCFFCADDVGFVILCKLDRSC